MPPIITLPIHTIEQARALAARELDERLTVDDVFDEADLAVYLSSVEACAMPAPPKPGPGR